MFGLLPCLSDCRVHAVYDPAEKCPLAACGVRIVPDIYLMDPLRIVMCRRCVAALPDIVKLRPAVGQWGRIHRSGRVGPLARWWRTCWYSRRIRCAMAAQACR